MWYRIKLPQKMEDVMVVVMGDGFIWDEGNQVCFYDFYMIIGNDTGPPSYHFPYDFKPPTNSSYFLNHSPQALQIYYYFRLMGNLLSETPTLYSLDLPPSKHADPFTLLTDQNQIPSPLHGKILVPVSKIPQRRELIAQYHHHVVLIEDAEEEQLYRMGVRGVPIIHEGDLEKDQTLCREAKFDCHFCPIPLVLERFHESYVKNYTNSFKFYGIRILSYAKVEHYIRSQCLNKFLICSNYELQQLSFKMKNRPGGSDPGKRLTILCFCNKEEYSISKRIEIFLQREGIDVVFFQNVLDIIERVTSEGLMTPVELQVRTERILFYLSQKEKQVDYLSKMAKRLQKSVRNVIVEKINTKNQLLQRVEKSNYSIILVSNDTKQIRSISELQQQLQRAGLEDRTIFIRRDNEINEKLTQHIYSVIQKPKYRRVTIFQKGLVFFGTIQAFKSVLRSFPGLKFKRFIDITRERQKILPFLQIQTQVIVSSVRICSCIQPYAHQTILCRVVHIVNKTSTIKAFQRRESHPACDKQHWFLEQSELLSYFSLQSQSNPLLRINFPYESKRLSSVGRSLNECFLKMKEKKTILYNKLNDSMFLFSSEYYILDQLATLMLKHFNSRLLGNYEQECLFERVRGMLYEEVAFLVGSRRIQPAVLDIIEQDESADVFELSHKVMAMVIEYAELREEVNSIWALLLHQDRKEHHTNCQTLLFLLLLAFSKTNFLKYSNQTLQGLTLAVKRTSISYDPQNLATFRNKNRNSFVYNVQFLACEVFHPGETPDPNDIIIRLDGNELMSFGLYLPIYVQGKRAVICPMSKFQINVKADRQSLLKINVHSQQKLLQKFSQTFLEESPGQLKLFGQERELRRFDAFLDSMAHSKFQTAGYLLKKVAKDEGLANQECLNAFHVLYHLKRRELQQAQQRLTKDRYFDFLSKVIDSQVEENPSPNPPAESSSNKRIEQSNKQYQNIEETSNDNESFDSAMIFTDPDMIKQLSSDYRLLSPKFVRGRSPSSKGGQEVNRRKPSKIPIRRKPELSISDKISQSGNEREKPLNIIILPPIRHLSSKEEPHQSGEGGLYSSTFGKKFMTEYSSLSSEKEKMSLKEDYGPLMRMKSTRSDAGDRLLSYEDGVIESSPMLNKRGSKQSQFLVIEREKTSGQDQDESRGELISIIEPSEIEPQEQTGCFFNFSPTHTTPSPVTTFTPTFKEEPQSLVQLEDPGDSIHEVEEQAEEQSLNSSEQDEPSATASETPLIPNNNEDPSKPFPIKKEFFKFPRKSLTEMHENLSLLQSPLRKIEEQRSSQLSLSASTAKFLLCSPQKQNSDRPRPKQNKLFTFYKISDPLKPRFSLNSNKNSLNLSNTDELQRIQEQGELFHNFKGEKERGEVELSELNSISSIEIQEAEQVFPEEMLSQP